MLSAILLRRFDGKRASHLLNLQSEDLPQLGILTVLRLLRENLLATTATRC